MVDAAVVSIVVEKLGEFLIQKVVSSQDVRDEVEWLQTELKIMQSFLKDAEEKQDGDDRVCQWISQIRDVAYDSEDVVDTFVLEQKVGRTSKRKRGFLDYLKFPSIFNKENIGICNEIKALKQRLVEISRRREFYGIRNLGDVGEGTGGANGNRRYLRRTSPYADEEHVVGFENVAASLVDKLLTKEPQRCVISIWGMGGLGKSTLARKLYHHSKVEGKFEYRAWVCVSQEYRIPDLLRRIIKSFKRTKEELERLEKMTDQEDLEWYLRKFLEGHQYLVVIDDVWEKEAWTILKRAFPDNKNGSRVIVTTRIKDVAESLDERTYVHELQFLSQHESWELFCKKVFPNHSATSHCPPDFQMLGREMVEKCGGLPLAIIVLGGLLSRKMPDEWHKVKEHIWWNLRKDSIDITPILTLSFNDLPYRTKPCFLYLGLFPEDFEINTEKLIRLWVAEGFIPPGEETSEEVAEDWLNELIGRSLIQVARRSWMKITACRVHDLLRDLAVETAKELKFLHIYDGNTISTPSSTSTVSSYRRHAAHFMPLERYVSVDCSNPCLRTLLFTNQDPGEPSNTNFFKFIHGRFRLLRVLDLHGGRRYMPRRSSLPDAVGELIHLRYLGLRNSGIAELPSSLVNLKALQTLDALTRAGFGRVRFPGNIDELKQLRHLIGEFERLPGVDQLTNLQTLKFVDVSDWIRINPVSLINLRELRIRAYSDSKEPIGFTCDPIGNLRNLQSLSINLTSQMRFPPIRPLYNCNRLLQLIICGRIKNLPEQMHKCLPNLKYLMLECYGLLQDPLPTLEKLPNLLILQLLHDKLRKLKKLSCTAEGFPRLEVLVLDTLYGLEELEVEEGAMPMLKGLRINDCDNLRVPERLRPIPDPSSLNWDWDDTEEDRSY